MKTINKSLLDADTKYIMHQCNCVTKHSKGIANAIFNEFPWANTYAKRNIPSVRGRIDVLGNGINERFVINAYIQYHPGKPSIDKTIEKDRKIDSYQNRLFYLEKCLQRIETIPDLKSIGIPSEMGCRLAKGLWSDYLSIIEDFAKRIKETQNAETFLYQYDSTNIKENNQETL